MKTRRRYLTFSLRSLFILTTALAVWLGVVVNRASEQREAVKAIEALGGVVLYDWHLSHFGNSPTWKPQGPGRLRQFVGDDFFQTVEEVYLMHPSFPLEHAISELILHCRRLRSLKTVIIFNTVSEETASELNARLRGCEIRLLGNRYLPQTEEAKLKEQLRQASAEGDRRAIKTIATMLQSASYCE
jgi:hypothetical protein